MWTTIETNSAGLTLKTARADRALGGWPVFYPLRAPACAIALLVSIAVAHSTTKPESENREPVTAREFYNEGARYLTQSNLWRAEFSFERALALQDERFQPPALYNLGHIRFTQGAEELKKGPPAQKTAVLARQF